MLLEAQIKKDSNPLNSVKGGFFSLYQFSNVCFEGISNSIWSTHVCTVYGYYFFNGDFGKIYVKDAPPLELKPISHLSNEDAQEIMNIENFEGEFNSNLVDNSFLEFLIDITQGRCNKFHIIDFLRKKGYAIPYMGYSVEDMVSFGWIKLIV